MASPTPLGIHQIAPNEKYALVYDLNRVGITADAAITMVKTRAEYLTDKAVMDAANLSQRALNELPGRVVAEVDRVIGDTREDAAEALATANKAYEYNQALVAPAADVVNAVVTDPETPAGSLVDSKVTVNELAVSPERLGAVADGITDDSAAITRALAAAASDRKTLSLSGHYYCAAPITVDQSVTIVGAGKAAYGTTAPAKLLFAAGVDGVKVTDAGQHSTLRGFLIESTSIGQGSGVGLSVAGRRVTVQDVNVRRFGGHGVAVDTTTGGNANLVQLLNVRSEANGGNGFHIAGIDSNVVTLIGTDAMSNRGWGYYDDGQHSLFINPHASANLGGAIYEDGNSPMWVHPYVEVLGDGTDRVVITAASPYGTWIAGDYGVPPLEAGNLPAQGWTVTAKGGAQGHLTLHDLAGPDRGTTYRLDNGVAAANTLRLRDETNKRAVLTVNASRAKWEIPVEYATPSCLMPVTAADLGSAAHPVNSGKRAGGTVWNLTARRPVYSAGISSTSPWVYADGTVAVTPA